MFLSVIDNAYKLQTSDLSAGELIAKIYELEHESIVEGIQVSYASPIDVMSLLLLRELKEYVFTYEGRSINTFKYRKEIDRLKEKYNLSNPEKFLQYKSISISKMEEVRDFLFAGENSTDGDVKAVFVQIKKIIFGDYYD